MSLPISFGPLVADDIRDAMGYYNAVRPGLGDDFWAAFLDAQARIQATPKMHQVIWNNVRRRLMPRRFPYGVFYEVFDDRIEVIAVYHLRRNPAGWQARV